MNISVVTFEAVLTGTDAAAAVDGSVSCCWLIKSSTEEYVSSGRVVVVKAESFTIMYFMIVMEFVVELIW